jgi:hypothetical protein
VAVNYELVLPTHAKTERVVDYVSTDPLAPGDVIVAGDRHWLVDRVVPDADGGPQRAHAAPARYRFRLRHPDDHEELGAFRRFRPGGPGLGHSFTTFEDGRPAIWSVVEETLAHDDSGAPFLDLVAERDYDETEEPPPDHELEHALEAEDWTVSDAATALLARAAEAGLSIELVALEPGVAPDWEEAERYIDTLIFEEIGDDVLLRCQADRAPRDKALAIVQERLRADLASSRADLEGNQDEIEEWDFRGGQIFATVGAFDDESDPDSPHGWLCRLVDSGVLTAAGFHRVRKPELV